MENKDLAEMVCANVKELLLFHQGANVPLEERRKKAGVGKGTVERIMNGTANLDAKILEKIAIKYQVQPWQLLIPGFDPADPPLLHEEAERRRIWNERQKIIIASEEGPAPPNKPISTRRNAA